MSLCRSNRILGLVLALAWLPATAQTLRLAEQGTGATDVKASVADTLAIEVRADLDRSEASGLSFFVTVPDGPFEVVDRTRDISSEIQPFSLGPLFEGAVEAANSVSHGADIGGRVADQQILSYSIVLGPGPDRARAGSGVVATFALRCRQPVPRTTIAIHSSPILETRLVLADGATERRFAAMQGIEITVGDPTLLEHRESWGGIKAGLGH